MISSERVAYAKASALDGLEELLGDDHVRVHVLERDRGRGRGKRERDSVACVIGDRMITMSVSTFWRGERKEERGKRFSPMSRLKTVFSSASSSHKPRQYQCTS
jgi:hypothetical protein